VQTNDYSYLVYFQHYHLAEYIIWSTIQPEWNTNRILGTGLVCTRVQHWLHCYYEYYGNPIYRIQRCLSI